MTAPALSLVEVDDNKDKIPTKYPRLPIAGIETGFGLLVRGTKSRPITNDYYNWIRSSAGNVSKKYDRDIRTKKISDNQILIYRQDW